MTRPRLLPILALSRNDGALTPTTLIDSLERLGRFDIGGFRLEYDTTSHHGTRYVDLGIWNGARLVR